MAAADDGDTPTGALSSAPLATGGLAPALAAARPIDDVDRIVAAWHRETPDLDVSPLHVLSRITRLARRLDLARGAAFADFGLEGWEFDVLSALRRAGRPYQLSPGQLVADTLVTSGTMTNRVDRLEHKGLVRRIPDPTDRRAWQLYLAPRAAELLNGMRGAIDALTAEATEGLSAAEREQLNDLVERVRANLSRRICQKEKEEAAA